MPEKTTLAVDDTVKMLRETLCVAQARIGDSPLDEDRRREHIARLGRLIAACDRQRPLGPDGRHCTDPYQHGPHRYADDDEFLDCPGTRVEDAIPTPCKTRLCARPGTNRAGFCCHGCAATRFGRELGHGRQCEETNRNGGVR